MPAKTHRKTVVDENTGNHDNGSFVTAENVSKVPFASSTNTNSVKKSANRPITKHFGATSTPLSANCINVDGVKSVVIPPPPPNTPATVGSTASTVASSVKPAVSAYKAKKIQRKKIAKKAKRAASKTQQALKVAEMAVDNATSLSVTQQQTVLNVLEYMLTEDKVDEITFRRLSNEKFSFESLRRLSAGGLPDAEAPLSPLQKQEMQVAENEESTAAAIVQAASPLPQAQADAANTCNDVPGNGRVLGDLDVLAALRTYIKLIEEEPVPEAEEEEVEGEVEGETMEVLESIEEEAKVVETETEALADIGSSVLHSIAAEIEDVAPEMNVSIVEETVIENIPQAQEEVANVASSSMETSDSPTPMPSTESSSNQSTHLADVIESALSSGLVSVSIKGYVERFGYVEFELAVEAGSIGSATQMMALRRYSQFATLHASLLKECGWGVSLPSFPGKQVLPSINNRWKDPSFLAGRQEALHSYMQGVLSMSQDMPPAARSAIRDFLIVATTAMQAQVTDSQPGAIC